MSDRLFRFLSQAVTPWHGASALAQRLGEAGFTELHETEPWQLVPGRGYYLRRGGTALAAWVLGSDPALGWNMAVAHTDSPGWKLKVGVQSPQPSGVVRIGTEVYGSPIHATWFDRPLAIAGRIYLGTPGGPQELLVRTEALGVFPNLAIHYNREVNKGQAYDLSEQLSFLAALGTHPSLQDFFARRYGFRVEDWLAADLFVVDPSEPQLLGSSDLFLSPRVDNLAGCHAVIEGLLGSLNRPASGHRLVLCFDQEEVGSSTWTGADSSMLGDLLARANLASGGSAEAAFRSKAGSFILSVDAAHGVHPNWASQHDGGSAPSLGRGPVLKASARFSYATTAATEARLRTVATAAGLPLQSFVMKSTLTPGSTVGPITTSWTGVPGVDVGIPIWAMHSCCETADRRDQAAMEALVSSFLSS